MKSILFKGMDKFKEGKTYLKPGEKPPEGVQVKTGGRGGKYFEEPSGEKSVDKIDEPKKSKSWDDIQPGDEIIYNNDRADVIDLIGKDSFIIKLPNGEEKRVFGYDIKLKEPVSEDEKSNKLNDIAQDVMDDFGKWDKNKFKKLAKRKGFSDEEISNHLKDIDTSELKTPSISEGAKVKIHSDYGGGYGELIEYSPSGLFAMVKTKDGMKYFDVSDLSE